MTGSDDGWVKFPDARHYEGHASGQIRSRPREKNGRTVGGTYPNPMKLREDSDGYLVFNYTDDEGKRHTNVSVARTILRLFDPDWRPWLQACHNGDQKDNRFPGGIRTDTPEANRQEALETRLANNPPKIRPPKVCPRCGAEHRDRGQRCHACVVQIGVEAAPLIVEDDDLDEVAAALDYPSGMGVYRLARKYGGLRHYVDAQGGLGSVVDLAAVGHSESPQRGLRRVINVARAWLANSDAA